MTEQPRSLWERIFGWTDPPHAVSTEVHRDDDIVVVTFSSPVTYLHMHPDDAFRLGQRLIFVSKGVEI